MKILVVDDEPQIRKLLKTGLAGYGYDVILASDGQSALAAIAQQSPDLIVLDISLGSQPDGLAVCQDLRTWSKVPIIVLSVRDDEKTKVAALNSGADDYLTKPFGMEELQARIQAVLRRITPSEGDKPTPEMHVKGLTIDFLHRRVTVDGEEVHFTPKEYDLLCLLATHPGKVLTHRALLTKVWGSDYDGMDHYVRVFVNQIRKKLRENPARDVRYILSEPGVGYRFVDVD